MSTTLLDIPGYVRAHVTSENQFLLLFVLLFLIVALLFIAAAWATIEVAYPWLDRMRERNAVEWTKTRGQWSALIDSYRKRPDTVQLHDRDYARLVNARNSMGAALQHIVDISDALSRQSDDFASSDLRNLSEKDLAEAVNAARVVLTEYGEHQAFVLF